MTEPDGQERFGSLAQVRAWYAEELRVTGPVEHETVVQAFARVPRELFLGPGPWRLRGDYRYSGYRSTSDADPRHVYHNVLVALDEASRVNNGSPSLWAFVLDQLDLAAGEAVLHLGCGTGYYSAILAELVGADGRVVAVEHDQVRAEQARQALAGWQQVTVVQADGASFAAGPQDAVVISAGATHPLPSWLAALRPGGRLVFPLTAQRDDGFMLKVTRGDREDRLAARFLCNVGFIPFIGARDAALAERLTAAKAQGNAYAVQSLRLDQHDADDTCWLHGDGFCLSTLATDPSEDAPAGDAEAPA
jgi:protein-L-isoaspartate(D-aspartate) O-methyltransferase